MIMITTEGVNKVADEIIKVIKNVDPDKVTAQQLKDFVWSIIKANAFHDDDKWVKK